MMVSTVLFALETIMRSCCSWVHSSLPFACLSLAAGARLSLGSSQSDRVDDPVDLTQNGAQTSFEKNCPPSFCERHTRAICPREGIIQPQLTAEMAPKKNTDTEKHR